MPGEGHTSKRGPIGIVLPGFGHPQFLAEAVICACEQDIDQDIKVVVVDDGCHFPETGDVVQNLIRKYPGKLHYLRQKNTRLPGARNAGIRFLLNIAPDLDAIFFLDADNRIEPYALRGFRQALGDDPQIGWAYPDIAFFGLTWGDLGFDIRETAPHYSKLKHLAGNISEAGSLVRADVFRQGVMFDETMRSGYEDWDFWLSALEAGFKGVRAEHAGFLYRRRPESMLADSRRLEEELIARLHRQHAPLFQPRALMQLEHEEAPAFGIVLTDRDEVLFTSDPLSVSETMSTEELVTRFRGWREAPREHFFPTRLFFMSAGQWQGLQERPQWLRWIFWALAEDSANFNAVEITEALVPGMIGIPAEIAPDQASILTADTVALSDLSMVSDTAQEWAQSVTLKRSRLHIPRAAQIQTAAVHCDMLIQTMLTLADRTGVPEQKITAVGKRYAGPSAQNVRTSLIEALCADEERKPFPSASRGRRVLIAVDHKVLAKDNGCGRFVSLLRRLKNQGVEIALVLEIGEGFDLEKLCPGSWLSFVGDVIPLHYGHAQSGFRIYLGRRITTQLPVYDKQTAAIIARSVDAVLTIGAAACQEVLGEARQHGVKGYVLLERDFVGDVGMTSPFLSKILAYEHAEERIVTNDRELVDVLSAEGVPPSKFVGYDDFLASPPW